MQPALPSVGDKRSKTSVRVPALESHGWMFWKAGNLTSDTVIGISLYVIAKKYV